MTRLLDNPDKFREELDRRGVPYAPEWYRRPWPEGVRSMDEFHAWQKVAAKQIERLNRERASVTA